MTRIERMIFYIDDNLGKDCFVMNKGYFQKYLKIISTYHQYKIPISYLCKSGRSVFIKQNELRHQDEPRTLGMSFHIQGTVPDTSLSAPSESPPYKQDLRGQYKPP